MYFVYVGLFCLHEMVKSFYLRENYWVVAGSEAIDDNLH